MTKIVNGTEKNIEYKIVQKSQKALQKSYSEKKDLNG
jgi:hypothetical protein